MSEVFLDVWRQAGRFQALCSPLLRAVPKPILNKLSDALDGALDDTNVRRRLLELGCVIPDRAQRGPQRLAALVKSEIARWTPILNGAKG